MISSPHWQNVGVHDDCDDWEIVTGPHPSVAATRTAVRDALDGLDIGTRVWVACSGGPDSLALAAATAFAARKDGLVPGAIIVDHGLFEGSDEVARRAAAQVKTLGIHDVHIERVEVGRIGGPESAARDARYAALEGRMAEEGGHHPQLLTGHTMDDQAEQVLLALARGSGARALAGIPVRRGNIVRPFLGLRRADTVAACEALGLEPWNDPTNHMDDGPKRSAVRTKVMPQLVDVLGPGVVSGLARSAALLQADADELDRQTRTAMTREVDRADCDALAALPEAIRRRMIKIVAEEAGAGPLGVVHVGAIDQLVMNYRGQGAVHLPGGYEARRVRGRLVVTHPTSERGTL